MSAHVNDIDSALDRLCTCHESGGVQDTPHETKFIARENDFHGAQQARLHQSCGHEAHSHSRDTGTAIAPVCPQDPSSNIPAQTEQAGLLYKSGYMVYCVRIWTIRHMMFRLVHCNEASCFSLFCSTIEVRSAGCMDAGLGRSSEMKDLRSRATVLSGLSCCNVRGDSAALKCSPQKIVEEHQLKHCQEVSAVTGQSEDACGTQDRSCERCERTPHKAVDSSTAPHCKPGPVASVLPAPSLGDLEQLSAVVRSWQAGSQHGRSCSDTTDSQELPSERVLETSDRAGSEKQAMIKQTSDRAGSEKLAVIKQTSDRAGSEKQATIKKTPERAGPEKRAMLKETSERTVSEEPAMIKPCECQGSQPKEATKAAASTLVQSSPRKATGRTPQKGSRAHPEKLQRAQEPLPAKREKREPKVVGLTQLKTPVPRTQTVHFKSLPFDLTTECCAAHSSAQQSPKEHESTCPLPSKPLPEQTLPPTPPSPSPPPLPPPTLPPPSLSLPPPPDPLPPPHAPLPPPALPPPPPPPAPLPPPDLPLPASSLPPPDLPPPPLPTLPPPAQPPAPDKLRPQSEPCAFHARALHPVITIDPVQLHQEIKALSALTLGCSKPAHAGPSCHADLTPGAPSNSSSKQVSIDLIAWKLYQQTVEDSTLVHKSFCARVQGNDVGSSMAVCSLESNMGNSFRSNWVKRRATRATGGTLTVVNCVVGTALPAHDRNITDLTGEHCARKTISQLEATLSDSGILLGSCDASLATSGSPTHAVGVASEKSSVLSPRTRRCLTDDDGSLEPELGEEAAHSCASCD
jgi:hypothetical protein